jgi:Ni,Fe-hydrogenase III large subunit
MPMSENEVLAMMRENAALCNLEAEVIIALKAYQVNDQEILNQQLNLIVVCLQRLDEVRKRYDPRSQS